MKKLIFISIIGFLTLTMAGCGKHYEKTETEKFAPDPRGKNTLRLENVSGSITIRKTTAEEIQITAKKIATVRKRDLDKPFDEIEIDISGQGEVIHVETVMNEIKRGLFSFDEQQKVDYEIYLPERFSVDISNVNGKIYVYDIQGNVKVESVNGDITLKNTPGESIIELVNGSIHTDLYSTVGFHAEVINGKIFVNLGDSINASVFASAINGNIETNDLVFENISEDDDEFRARLGNGLYPINAKTVNGKITFERLNRVGGNTKSDIGSNMSKEQIYLEKKKELKDAQRKLEEAQRELDKAEKEYLERNNTPSDTSRSDSIKTL